MKFLNSILSAFVLVSASAALEDAKVEKEFNKADIKSLLANADLSKRGLNEFPGCPYLPGCPDAPIYPLQILKESLKAAESATSFPYTFLSQYAGMKYDVQLIPVSFTYGYFFL